MAGTIRKASNQCQRFPALIHLNLGYSAGPDAGGSAEHAAGRIEQIV